MKKKLVPRILELLDAAMEGNLEILARYIEGDMGVVTILLEDLVAVSSVLCTTYEPIAEVFEHAYIAEMLENVQDTLISIEQAIEKDRSDKVLMLMEFQLFPFLRQLREAFYFYGLIYPEKQKMDAYYANEFVERYQNPYVTDDKPVKYHVSVLVLAYNHLEKTKQCVQSIIETTDFVKLNAELVLIDHGSTDSTLEYFEQIGVNKVIHFKKNIRSGAMCIGEMICEGKYCAMVWNDTVLTNGWLEILLQCIESDDKIISASASVPNIANLQAVHVPNLGLRQFNDYANSHNRSDSKKWNDRSRICPQVTVYNVRNLNQTGFFDVLFYTMDYIDDDFSVRARRHGYRQILCEDVFCYHYGSRTSKAMHEGANNSLVIGREIFIQKHGFDPWGNGFCYDLTAIKLLTKGVKQSSSIAALCIDCGMGDSALQFRNEMRQKGIRCSLYQITDQVMFAPDLRPMSDNFVLAEVGGCTQALADSFPDILFDVVFLSLSLEKYSDYKVLLSLLRDRMQIGGCLVFSCKNPFFITNLNQMLHFSLSDQECTILFSIDRLTQHLQKIFSTVETTALLRNIDGLDKFIAQFYPQQTDKRKLTTMLSSEKYYFVCKK